MKTILSYLKYFFVPIYCSDCDQEIAYSSFKEILCYNCKQKINKTISSKIKLNNNYDITIHSISKYENPLKKIILEKTKSNYLASIQIAHLIWELSNLRYLEFDCIIPIPLHWTRYAYRGYNQSEVIAKELSKLSNKPVLNCLIRKKKTDFQYSLNLIGKKENLHEAFELMDDKINIFNKKIMIVDDVITSGSTIKEASKILMKLNPKNINAIVACKTE